MEPSLPRDEDSILAEIVHRCSERGLVVSRELASFFARSVILNRNLGFSNLTSSSFSSAASSSSKISDLIHLCINRLSQQDSPRLETIKMQIALSIAQRDFETEILRKHKSRRFKSRRIAGDILSKNQELEVFGDMVIYILHKTRLLRTTRGSAAGSIDSESMSSSPTITEKNEKIEEETMTALESVIPREYVTSFMRQEDEDKKKQLHELWKIVWGINIFNHCSRNTPTTGGAGDGDDQSVGEGGAGSMGDVVDSQEEDEFQNHLKIFRRKEIEQLDVEIEDELGEISKKIRSIEDVMRTKCSLDRNDVRVQSTGEIKQGGKQLLERLRQELINRRQYYVFLMRFAQIVRDALHTLESVQEQFLSETDSIREIVTSRRTVEKSRIYPHFMSLASLWKRAEKVVRVDVCGVRHRLRFLRTYRHSYNEKIDEVESEGEGEEGNENPEDEEDEELALKAQRGELPSVWYQVQDDPLHPYLIPHDDHVRISEMKFALSGFDPVSLIVGKRILRPYSPLVDCVAYRSRLYGFATFRTMRMFFEDAEGMLSRLHDFVEIEAELVHLFGLLDVMPKSIIAQQDVEAAKTASIAIETEMHPVESHIDPAYSFSEWKLRKRALMIADLRNKRTHGAQTRKSHFRRDNDAQVYLKKNTASQTTKETGANPRRHLRYVKNLRGQPRKRVKVVQVSFDQDF